MSHMYNASNHHFQRDEYSLQYLKELACKAYKLNNVKIARAGYGFPPTVNAATARGVTV